MLKKKTKFAGLNDWVVLLLLDLILCSGPNGWFYGYRNNAFEVTAIHPKEVVHTYP